MSHRRFVVASDRAAAIAALAAKPARFSTACVDNATGMPCGSANPRRRRSLCRNGPRALRGVPGFSQSEVDRCAEILRPQLGLDIRDVLYPKNRDWRKAFGVILAST